MLRNHAWQVNISLHSASSGTLNTDLPAQFTARCHEGNGHHPCAVSQVHRNEKKCTQQLYDSDGILINTQTKNAFQELVFSPLNYWNTTQEDRSTYHIWLPFSLDDLLSVQTKLSTYRHAYRLFTAWLVTEPHQIHITHITMMQTIF